eukprot:Partr_v1_DN26779_c0_g1_i2_m8467 putative periodic tryptophan protein
MISAISFVPRGVARKTPEKFEMDDEEYQRIISMTEEHLNIANNDLTAAREADGEAVEEVIDEEMDAELAEYQMDKYDEEANEEPELFATARENLAVYRDNNEDPYITLKDHDMEDEDKEDVEIQESDVLVVVGKTEEDLSHLEVCVFDIASDSLYVHHDIMLPSCPLALEPVNCLIDGGRNWCAVGSFDPTIEIWNLDVIDAMYPHAILGHVVDPGAAAKAKKSSKKGKKTKVSAELTGHSDAVLCLAWNALAHNFLLSGSADNQVILWDVVTEKPIRQFSHHSDKVSCVKWHPSLASCFISAGYDKCVYFVDAQQLEQPVLSKLQLDSDVECMGWDLHAVDGQVGFVVGTDSGMVHYIQISSTDNSLSKRLTVSAYSSALTSVDIHPHIPGCMMTTAAESTEQLKMWDIYGADANGETLRATMLAAKDVGGGKLYCGEICRGEAYLTAAAGSFGQLCLWNLTESKAICKRFHGRQGKSGL